MFGSPVAKFGSGEILYLGEPPGAFLEQPPGIVLAPPGSALEVLWQVSVVRSRSAEMSDNQI